MPLFSVISSVPLSFRMASMRAGDTEGLNLTNTSPGTNGWAIIRTVLFSAMFDIEGLLVSQAVKNKLVLERRTLSVRRTRIALDIGDGVLLCGEVMVTRCHSTNRAILCLNTQECNTLVGGGTVSLVLANAMSGENARMSSSVVNALVYFATPTAAPAGDPSTSLSVPRVLRLLALPERIPWRILPIPPTQAVFEQCVVGVSGFTIDITCCVCAPKGRGIYFR